MFKDKVEAVCVLNKRFTVSLVKFLPPRPAVPPHSLRQQDCAITS